MGLWLMENFDVADLTTLTTPRVLAAVPSGYVGATGHLIETAGTIPSVVAPYTFTEKGARRNSLRMMANFVGTNAAGTGAIRIPLPPMQNVSGGNQARSYYASMRLRFLKGNSTVPADATPLQVMDRAQVYIGAGYYPNYSYTSQNQFFLTTNSTVNTDGDISKNRIFLGPGTSLTSPHVDFKGDADGWFHVEVFKPAGTWNFIIWINDYRYVATAGTDVNQLNANTMYLNLFMGRTATLTGNPLYYGLEVADVIVIDPSTAGQQYRYGSSARVLSMDYTSDITNQWAADPSATLSHRQMMMVDKSVPDATNILTGTAVGQREQYGMQSIPSEFGQYVPVVAVRPRVMNGGASAHGISMEMDWGAGLTEVGTKMVAAGGAYDTTPLIMTTKPNGDPWTAADFASAKAGFSVKS